MNLNFFVLCIFSLLLTIKLSTAIEYAPIVQTKHGQIRGLVNTVGLWTKSYLYQGIRYATAERFTKPVRVEKFDEEIYDAIMERNSCPQFLGGLGNTDRYHKTNKSEDCLFLNVYTPTPKTDDSNGDGGEKLLPVMVWFYGGGFQCGTIFFPLYDGTYLANYGNVLVVFINYRVGPFGFLYAGTDDIPGNQAFYDQIMGLEWVRDNIQNFGGDPNQVTIFGESAGSFSVSALVLSPLAKGLFHRAIMQSGTIVPTVRFSNKQGALDKTKNLAKKLNCKVDDNEEISTVIDCLRSKSMEEIVDVATGNIEEMISNQMIGPILGDAFLPEDVLKFKYGSNGPVDIMFGVTRDEGSYFVVHFVPELKDDNTVMNEEEIRKNIRKILSSYHIEDHKEIEDYYLKQIDINDFNQVRKMFSDMFGDLRFNCPVMLYGQQMARANPKNHFYAYRFDHRTLVSDRMHCYEWMGVCHASEILYVFSNSMLTLYPKDSQLSIDIMNSWTNFAKTGNPSPIGSSLEWPEAFDDNQLSSSSTMNWMILDIEHRIEKDIYKDVCEKIWSKQYHDWLAKYFVDKSGSNNEKDEL
uniref:Carboxylic ester hydrolase n=1 Tax=Dermatophagoides pteronyssinus TaxID=6956 RepID=A0A6P6XSP9_DERPT|nr:cholinesterase 1-like [Dermatophagoides pteronyssinus]